MQTDRPTLTVGILTLNESHRIKRCIESARFADAIIVIDSGSTDETVRIATELGAKVIEATDWQGFAEQRNRLLAAVQTDYVFFLDADEVISDSLATEICSSIHSHVDIGKVIWREIAFGQPLKYFKNTSGITRLFNLNVLDHFDGIVHETFHLKSKPNFTITYKSTLDHYSRESVVACTKKLAQYVQLGAAKRVQQGKQGGIFRGMASALTIFIKLYFFRRGFLNGGAGFLFCFFVSLECFLRYAAIEYDPQITHYLSKR